MPSIIEKELERTQKNYQKQTEKQLFQAIIYGYIKSGKTQSLSTWPFTDDDKPNIFIDSFDPNGTLPLYNEIKAGKIIVDSSYEHEFYNSPKAFINWNKNFNKRKQMGFYQQFDLICIDSLTGWLIALENWITYRGKSNDNREDYAFSRIDYGYERGYFNKLALNSMASYLSLGKNVILFAHRVEKNAYVDKKTQKMSGAIDGNYTYQTFDSPGSLSTKIGKSFSEIWYTQPLFDKDGIRKVNFITRGKQNQLGGSRLSKVFDIPKVIPADFSKFMKIIKEGTK